ncbi:hypothetical protein C4561_03110 [candidate division WWE3 bacterium]|jgi:ribulose-phosphate 3-epimerase|uniref:Ribulose-phosphate 3-epimerase n=1 Tax=candidate division WWE3 bacterium TaxID=2053526 RepID=A0A3A4ZJU7_UNCKA|nr:MAG: hypothetical protein C4561_03110 [candidate division WWE3 bacterium]
MIIPAILEKNFRDIEDKVSIAESFSEMVQIDFVDGKLFEGSTFQDIEALNNLESNLKYDLHLLVVNPLDYLVKIKNAVKICSQIEGFGSKAEVEEFIKKAKILGYRVGLSLGPTTDFEIIQDFVKDLDFVQFMTIIPGGQGRDFIPGVLQKIERFKLTYPKVQIQVDGGVNEKTIPGIVHAGVDDMIIGSAIFGSTNPRKKYLQLTSMQNKQDINNEETIVTLKRERITKVAFLGGAAWVENDQPYKEAYETARAVAEAGFEVVNGGGPGVMRASTEGAHAGGGKVLAITYHPNKPKRHYEGVDPENHFDDEVITLDYFDRTKVMLQTTQVHIVFKGSIGTLSEFGMSWISSWIHEPNNKPIILFGAFWQDFLDVIHKHMLLKNSEEDMLKICTTPEEVIEFLKSLKKD